MKLRHGLALVCLGCAALVLLVRRAGVGAALEPVWDGLYWVLLLGALLFLLRRRPRRPVRR